MFVINYHALQTINLLNLFNHKGCQGFLSQDTQDILWYRVTINQFFSLFHNIATAYQQVCSLWYRIFNRCCAVCWFNTDNNFVFSVFQFDCTINFRQQCWVCWTAYFQQFVNTWQTTCNIACTFCLNWDTGQDITCNNLVTIGNIQYGIDWQQIFCNLFPAQGNNISLVIDQCNRRF